MSWHTDEVVERLRAVRARIGRVEAMNERPVPLPSPARLEEAIGFLRLALFPRHATGRVLNDDAMRDVVGRVNEQQNIASSLMTAVDAGQSDDLVGAMVASQKAGLSFSALMQVRNKLMTGFDDIMRMPL